MQHVKGQEINRKRKKNYRRSNHCLLMLLYHRFNALLPEDHRHPMIQLLLKCKPSKRKSHTGGAHAATWDLKNEVNIHIGFHVL